MTSAMASITRAATRGGEPLNVLCMSAHESFETNLAKTGHNFYAYRDDGAKGWDTTYRSVPKNYTILPKHEIPPDIDFDLVLSHNKYSNQALWGIARSLHLGHLHVEHCLPVPNVPKAYLEQMKSIRGNVNAFISSFSRDAWGWASHEAEVVYHGMDTEFFHPGGDRENVLLSVVNDWVARDVYCGFNFWREATEGLPVRVLGRTPNLSEPAENAEALALAYRTSRIFVNTSLISPLPMALMEAMASGCAIVSTATAVIPEVISHGENGYLARTPAEMREWLEYLLEEPEVCAFIGENARKTIEDRFGLGQFVRNWDRVLRKTADIVFKG